MTKPEFQELQQLQIEIATGLQWTRLEVQFGWLIGIRPGYGSAECVPQWPWSIDIIRSLAMERFNTTERATRFEQELNKIAHSKQGDVWPRQLTAADWCEAFLRVEI